MTYILVGLSLFGFIPFLVILYRKRSFDRMRRSGVATSATVAELFGISYRGMNRMRIEYRNVSTGEWHSKNLLVAGLPYTVGQQLPIYYDPANASRVQLDMKKSWVPMMIFTLLIAAVVIFAAWKLGTTGLA